MLNGGARGKGTGGAQLSAPTWSELQNNAKIQYSQWPEHEQTLWNKIIIEPLDILEDVLQEVINDSSMTVDN